MAKLKLLSAALIAAASLATPAMGSHEPLKTSRQNRARGAQLRAPFDGRVGISAPARRPHFLRAPPRTGKIATSVITRGIC